MECVHIPRYRHLKRYRQIANSLFRHGFGYLLTQSGLTRFLPSVRRAQKNEETFSHSTRARRLRKLLEELGPTFVKFGQLLSTRPDLVPRDILDELSLLRDRVSPFPYSEARSIIEREMGKPLDEIFAAFEEEPIAAASVGQVHRALLHEGDEVVVKVRRPHITGQMRLDLEILLEMARLADRHTSWGAVYHFGDVVQELQRAVSNELDYLTEAENMEQVRANLRHRRDILIPKVYRQYTTSAVLTMEHISGIRLDRQDQIAATGKKPQEMVRLLVDAIFEQIFDHGLFHADPHPGNLAVSGDGQLILMDFGIVGRLRGERRRQFILFLLGTVNRNPRQIVRSLANMGILSRRIDRKALRRDVEYLMDRYLDVPLGKIELGKTVREILSLAFEYHIRIPPEFTLLAKTLMTLEGVIEELADDLKLLELLKPYTGRLIKERFSPAAVKESVSEQFWETTDFLFSLSRRLNELFERMEVDGFPLQVNYPDLDKAFSHMDRLANRISFSIVLLALSLVIAGLIISSALVATITGETALWRLPIIETGFIIAGGMSVWLLWAILRSGRL